MIFAHAAEVPGILDLTPLPPLSDEKRAFTCFPDPSIGFSALRTKRNLILVCKSWQTLALEFLYAFIWLWKPRDLFSLIRSFTQSANIAQASALDGATYTPGRYIKCLWLSMGQFDSDDPHTMGALQDLFSLCHNLHVLRIWTINFPMNLPVIAERSQYLRYAEMYWIRDGESPTFAPRLLEKMPQYDALEALSLSFPETAVLFPDHPIFLSRLHSLILDVSYKSIKDQIMGLIALWKLPSLVYLSLAVRGNFTPPMEQFFCSFGHNLTSLLVARVDSTLIPNILRHCPSVQNLFIKFLPQAEPPYIPFPPIPHLRRIQFRGNISERCTVMCL
jgi:hypothetical protein